MTDTPPPGGLLAHLAQISGVTPDTERARRAADLIDRARQALRYHDGHPNGAWSIGEQVAVALILNNHDALDRLDYTTAQAAERVAGDMFYPPVDLNGWLDSIRAQLTAED